MSTATGPSPASSPNCEGSSPYLCCDAKAAHGLREARDALVDLVRRHARVGQPQRVAAAVEQEVRALDEQHLALRRGLLQLGHVDLLGQLHPHEVAALRTREAGLGELALQRGADRVAALA